MAAALAVAAAAPLAALPTAGAWLLLHGTRRIAVPPAPDGCEATHFAGAGVDLAGWRCTTAQRRRGTLIYLHGISDNRKGARGLVHGSAVCASTSWRTTAVRTASRRRL